MHLRGGIDYSCLGFKHKTMMAMLYKKATGLPEEKKTAEVKAMIETYNQKVDFINFGCLDEISTSSTPAKTLLDAAINLLVVKILSIRLAKYIIAAFFCQTSIEYYLA